MLALIVGIASLDPHAPASEASPAAQRPASRPTEPWPQWGGPRRNFTSTSTGLATTWPARGPRRRWSRPLGDGHSGIVSDIERLYTMYRRGDREYLIALDAATGQTRWELGYESPLPPNMDTTYGVGPHATPLLTGSLVCSAGATARLLCVDRQTGKEVWRRDLWQEFGGTFLNIGYSTSPLEYRDTIIVQVGGQAALLAFARDTGVERWRTQSFRNSSSSPILISLAGRDQVIALMHREVIGVEPSSGRLLWTHPAVGPTDWNFHFNISTPLWSPDGLLFVSAAYGLGARVLRLTASGDRTDVAQVWQSTRLRVHHENAVRAGQVIYAANGHLGPAPFSAVDILTGKVLWQDRTFSHATFIHADGRFILLDEDGQLGLATATPTGLTVHSRTQLFDGRSWTVPTLVGTTLYARDRKSIVALELGAPAAARGDGHGARGGHGSAVPLR